MVSLQDELRVFVGLQTSGLYNGSTVDSLASVLDKSLLGESGAKAKLIARSISYVAALHVGIPDEAVSRCMTIFYNDLFIIIILLFRCPSSLRPVFKKYEIGSMNNI